MDDILNDNENNNTEQITINDNIGETDDNITTITQENINVPFETLPYYAKELPPDAIAEQTLTENEPISFGRKFFYGLMVGLILFMLCIAASNYQQGMKVIPSVSRVITYDTPDYDIEYKSKNEEILTAPQIANKCKGSNVAVLSYKNKVIDGSGSGVVMCIDANKKYTYVMTCAHVIDSTDSKIAVKVYDGKTLDAEIIGIDKTTDLAVIRIKYNKLQPVEFGNSDKLVTGCTVYAIGNPGGAEYFGSMTKGIISEVERPVKTKSGYEYTCIQHDAAVNPGSSGGMLVNEYGQVVGINSQKVAESSYEGMSFSVPSKMVIYVFNNIINSYFHISDTTTKAS